MGYLGNTPAESFLSFEKQVFTIVNSQTAYTLNFSVTNENDIRLVINNIIQEPGTGKAYTANGTTLTLSAALTNGTDEMYCVFLGRARETVTVPDIQTGNIADDAVTKAKVNFISDSTAGVEVKGDGGSNDGYIQLNCRVNSHGIKLKGPPHSAGQSYTMVYPTTNITAGKFLKVDSVSGSGATGIGQLSFADAGGITEYDQWRVTADFSGDVDPITSNLERVDSYNWEKIGTGMTESSGVFTFPSTGKYWIFLNAMSRNPSSSGERNHSFSLSISTDTGSNFNTPVGISNNISYHSSSVANQQSVSGHYLFDVTNTSTHQVRFGVTALGNDATVVEGDTDQSKTYFTFIKVGET